MIIPMYFYKHFECRTLNCNFYTVVLLLLLELYIWILLHTPLVWGAPRQPWRPPLRLVRQDAWTSLKQSYIQFKFFIVMYTTFTSSFLTDMYIKKMYLKEKSILNTFQGWNVSKASSIATCQILKAGIKSVVGLCDQIFPNVNKKLDLDSIYLGIVSTDRSLRWDNIKHWHTGHHQLDWQRWKHGTLHKGKLF